MSNQVLKLLTIVTEAALENTLAKSIERLGAHGYTITDARGKGGRGVRNAAWEASRNIRIEIISDEETIEAISGHLKNNFYDNYAMVLFKTDVEVTRPEKFKGYCK